MTPGVERLLSSRGYEEIPLQKPLRLSSQFATVAVLHRPLKTPLAWGKSGKCACEKSLIKNKSVLL